MLLICSLFYLYFFSSSLPKHRIGTKRHRVCLEVPQEVSQSEAFPKEELVPVQFEMEVAEPPVGPAREPVQQGDQGLAPSGNSSFLQDPTPFHLTVGFVTET